MAKKVKPKKIKKKTKKALVGRVKITANGKVKFSSPGRRHLLSSKSGKRKRKMRARRILTGANAKRFKEMLAS